MRIEYFLCYKTSPNEYIWKYKPTTKNNSLFVLGELRRFKNSDFSLRVVAVDGYLVYIRTGLSSKSIFDSNVFYVEGFIVPATSKYILEFDKESVYENLMTHIRPYLLSEDEHQNDRVVSMNISIDELVRLGVSLETRKTKQVKPRKRAKGLSYVHSIFDDLIS